MLIGCHHGINNIQLDYIQASNFDLFEKTLLAQDNSVWIIYSLQGLVAFLAIDFPKALLSTKTNQVHAIIRDQTLETRLADGFLKSNFHAYDGTLNSLRKTIDHVQPTLIYNLSSLYMRDTSSENIEAMVESNFLFGLKLLEVLKERDIKSLISIFINFSICLNSQYFSISP